MNKLLVLFLFWPVPGRSQDSTSALAKPFKLTHTVYAGFQIPLNYAVGYRLQFSPRLSAQVQGGLIAAPFERYTLKLLTGFGLDRNLSGLIDRSFRQGTSLSVGVNVHARSRWYAGLFAQYVRLGAGPVTPAEGLGLYFKQDFSGFGLLDSPAFVFNLQSSLWVGGLRVGRSVGFSHSRFGLNLEASLGKILATRNHFSSNRSLVDGLGITQGLYRSLSDEIDGRLRRSGYLPTVNAWLTYQLN